MVIIRIKLPSGQRVEVKIGVVGIGLFVVCLALAFLMVTGKLSPEQIIEAIKALFS